jgi:hypothetical protein
MLSKEVRKIQAKDKGNKEKKATAATASTGAFHHTINNSDACMTELEMNDAMKVLNISPLIRSLPLPIPSLIFGDYLVTHDLLTLEITCQLMIHYIRSYLSTSCRTLNISSLHHYSLFLPYTRSQRVQSVRFALAHPVSFKSDDIGLALGINLNILGTCYGLYGLLTTSHKSLRCLEMIPPSPLQQYDMDRGESFFWSPPLSQQFITHLISSCSKLTHIVLKKELELRNVDEYERVNYSGDYDRFLRSLIPSFTSTPPMSSCFPALQHLELGELPFSVDDVNGLTYHHSHRLTTLIFGLHRGGNPLAIRVEMAKALTKLVSSLTNCQQLMITSFDLSVDGVMEWKWILPPSLQQLSLLAITKGSCPILVPSSASPSRLSHVSLIWMQEFNRETDATRFITSVLPTLSHLTLQSTTIVMGLEPSQPFHMLKSLAIGPIARVSGQELLFTYHQTVLLLQHPTLSLTLSSLRLWVHEDNDACDIIASSILHRMKQLQIFELNFGQPSPFAATVKRDTTNDKHSLSLLQRFIPPSGKDDVKRQQWVHSNLKQVCTTTLHWLTISKWFFPSLVSFEWKKSYSPNQPSGSDESIVHAFHDFLNRHASTLRLLSIWSRLLSFNRASSNWKNEYPSLSPIPMISLLHLSIDVTWILVMSPVLIVRPGQLNYLHLLSSLPYGNELPILLTASNLQKKRLPFGLTSSTPRPTKDTSSSTSSANPTGATTAFNEYDDACDRHTIVNAMVCGYQADQLQSWRTFLWRGNAIQRVIVDSQDSTHDEQVSFHRLKRNVVNHFPDVDHRLIMRRCYRHPDLVIP